MSKPISIPAAPRTEPELPEPVILAMLDSANRFEAMLRKELGAMANFADVPKYVTNYKAELRTFYRDLIAKGMAKL